MFGFGVWFAACGFPAWFCCGLLCWYASGLVTLALVLGCCLCSLVCLGCCFNCLLVLLFRLGLVCCGLMVLVGGGLDVFGMMRVR